MPIGSHRIAGSDFSHKMVSSRFSKLDSKHIRFVMDCMYKKYHGDLQHEPVSNNNPIQSSITISNYCTEQDNHYIHAGGW